MNAEAAAVGGRYRPVLARVYVNFQIFSAVPPMRLYGSIAIGSQRFQSPRRLDFLDAGGGLVARDAPPRTR
ncbi:MAG: hypothetical protein ABW318_21170 [Vicinamibacterales bacterium]